VTATIRPDQLLTSHEVGSLLQMDPSSIVKWVNDGILPAYRTPGGHRRIRSSELLSFLRTHSMYIPDALRGAGIKVLLVDDDTSLLQSLSRAMKSHKDKFELSTSSSGIEALVKLGSERPDILVIDVHMPGLDGFEVLKRLKQNPATSGINVVFFTGKPSAELEKRAVEAGAKALLAKPLTAAKLVEVIGGPEQSLHG
jgi:excisionase family DNA binding protein